MTKISDTINKLQVLPFSQTHGAGANADEPKTTPVTPVDDDLEQDLFDARRNIKEIAEIGMQAVAEAADLASQSQHDKLYVALSSVMKSTLEANRELLDVHRTRAELTAEDNQGQGGDITNNLFVGTTTELQELLKSNIIEAKKND